MLPVPVSIPAPRAAYDGLGDPVDEAERLAVLLFFQQRPEQHGCDLLSETLKSAPALIHQGVEFLPAVRIDQQDRIRRPFWSAPKPVLRLVVLVHIAEGPRPPGA